MVSKTIKVLLNII